MYLRLTKIDENALTATYQIEIDVPGKPYVHKTGRKRYKLTTKRVTFAFDKKKKCLHFLTFEKGLNMQQIQAACLYKMLECEKNNLYPDNLVYASS